MSKFFFNVLLNIFQIQISLINHQGHCTATEMIPTIQMISATEMTPDHHRNDPHHRNDNYSQSK